MRKYNVTLLVVDQRPSGIDEEVMSLLGTKLVCLLDNERDVDAVTAGTYGARELRSVLSRLDQQAAVAGVRTLGADSRGAPRQGLRHGGVLPRAWLP